MLFEKCGQIGNIELREARQTFNKVDDRFCVVAELVEHVLPDELNGLLVDAIGRERLGLVESETVDGTLIHVDHVARELLVRFEALFAQILGQARLVEQKSRPGYCRAIVHDLVVDLLAAQDRRRGWCIVGLDYFLHL